MFRELADLIVARIMLRAPDMVIGGADRPYLLRWYVIPRNPIFNIYLHEFRRDDDDRALHDHPWFSLSVVLRGCYTEHSIAAGGINKRREFHAGDVILRSPWRAHRIELCHGMARTLFITGPRVREWGFHCPQGWVLWEKFVATSDSGSIGKGCAQ